MKEINLTNSEKLQIGLQVNKKYSVGYFYTCSDVKKHLQSLYGDVESKRIAKANDLDMWFLIEETTKKINNKTVRGIYLKMKKYGKN